MGLTIRRQGADPQIRLEGISKTFGTSPAVIDVSLEIETGEVLALL